MLCTASDRLFNLIYGELIIIVNKNFESVVYKKFSMRPLGDSSKGEKIQKLPGVLGDFSLTSGENYAQFEFSGIARSPAVKEFLFQKVPRIFIFTITKFTNGCQVFYSYFFFLKECENAEFFSGNLR